MKSNSMKWWLRANATLMLCLCMVTMIFGASAQALSNDPQDGLNLEQKGEFSDEEAVTNAPQATLVITEATALTLVKESLQADDTWAITLDGYADDNGTSYYVIMAVDPIGDAHCRLVNGATGEVTVKTLGIAQDEEAMQDNEDVQREQEGEPADREDAKDHKENDQDKQSYDDDSADAETDI